MAEQKKVWVKWLKAFSGRPVGSITEVDEADAKYWISEKWCVKSSGPPEDKAEKTAPVVK